MSFDVSLHVCLSKLRLEAMSHYVNKVFNTLSVDYLLKAFKTRSYACMLCIHFVQPQNK